MRRGQGVLLDANYVEGTASRRTAVPAARLRFSVVKRAVLTFFSVPSRCVLWSWRVRVGLLRGCKQ